MANNDRDTVVSYFNDILVREEERTLVLTGRSQYWRFAFDMVGIDFVPPDKIEGTTLEEILDNCIKNVRLFQQPDISFSV